MKRLILIGAALAASTCSAGVHPTGERASRGVDVYLPADVRLVSARVIPGATLASLLRAHEIAETAARSAFGVGLAQLRSQQIRGRPFGGFREIPEPREQSLIEIMAIFAIDQMVLRLLP